MSYYPQIIANVNRPMDEKQKEGRDYTYSELGRQMEKLSTLSKQIQIF